MVVQYTRKVARLDASQTNETLEKFINRPEFESYMLIQVDRVSPAVTQCIFQKWEAQK